MSLYAVEINLDNRNSSHTQVVELVGDARRVLDVGCWTGDLGAVLTSRGATVAGVELVEEAAAVAADRLAEVKVADLDRSPLSTLFAPQSFDAIVFADVLEHLVDPEAVLRDAQALLAEGGRIVVSIPNVTHGSLRLALLQGRWEMTDTGLLDRTHIKFYSRSGLFELLAAAGLSVVDLRGTTCDPLSSEVAVDESNLAPGVIEWVRDQPDALVYQFQLAAIPGGPGDTTPPELIPGAPFSEARRADKYSTARRQAAHAELRMRDNVIGLQAEAVAAREMTKRVRERAERLNQRVKSLNERVKQQQERIQALERRTARGLARRVKRRVLR